MHRSVDLIAALIRRPQRSIDPLELGWIDQVTLAVISGRREATFLDGTDDRRAILAGELGCAAYVDEGHRLTRCKVAHSSMRAPMRATDPCQEWATQGNG